jgi:tetratricopeptide (TPR) repeat protein
MKHYLKKPSRKPIYNENKQYTLINKTYHVVTDPKSEKYKKALSDFNETILREPDFTYAYYNRAYVKYKLQDYKGAVDDYSHIIRIDPDFAEAFYNRGLLLFRLHDNLNACRDFSKAGELGLTEAYIVIKQYCSQITK